MATEILRPQDALVHRFRMHTSLASNQNHQRRPSTKQEKKRKPNQCGDARRRRELVAPAAGKITLLRRGESLNSIANRIGDSNPVDSPAVDPARSPRARSDSELIDQRKVRAVAALPMVNVYAGAGFGSSPSPRCVPRPKFVGMSNEAFEDGATRSLRRMLRLE
ncbi:hypothetical protein AAHA92_27733 [Salvia divinorum]|uniref:Uncharacterized protein n=1 Tax=Salvia divinorum TaxID=28513 RepID=A0ABD1G5P2_SALDI